jgi:GH24 family phage-related lysozyme (muramidase)
VNNCIKVEMMQRESKLDCDSERIWKIIDKYMPKEKAQKRPESESLYDNMYNCYINSLGSDKVCLRVKLIYEV